MLSRWQQEVTFSINIRLPVIFKCPPDSSREESLMTCTFLFTPRYTRDSTYENFVQPNVLRCHFLTVRDNERNSGLRRVLWCYSRHDDRMAARNEYSRGSTVGYYFPIAHKTKAENYVVTSTPVFDTRRTWNGIRKLFIMTFHRVYFQNAREMAPKLHFMTCAVIYSENAHSVAAGEYSQETRRYYF